MDRSEKEVVRTHHRHEFQTFGKVFFDVFQQFSDVFVYFRGVRAGYLEYHERTTRMAVYITVESIGLCTQFHTGYVLKTQYITIGHGAYNYVLEFFDAFQTTFVFHGELECVLGIFTQRAGRGFQVLFTQHGCHIGWN